MQLHYLLVVVTASDVKVTSSINSSITFVNNYNIQTELSFFSNQTEANSFESNPSYSKNEPKLNQHKITILHIPIFHA